MMARMVNGIKELFLEQSCHGRRGLLFFLLWAVLAIACAPVPLAAPTRMPLARMPAGGVASVGGPPPTWTRAAAAASDAAEVNFATPQPLGATSTPTVTPILPSRTPRPPTPTPSATPLSPTPYVSFIPDLPPTDELGPSKLGLHVIRNNDAGIMGFVRQAQPAVIKAVDDLGFLAEVKSASPWTVTVGRLETGRGPNYARNPEEAARDFVNEQLEQYLANPAVDYWEGYNEPDPNMENMVWYSRFEQERVRLLAQHGLRAAIGGFATGVPELDEFELFSAAVIVAKEYGGILSLHEYGAPDMTYLYGSPLPGQEAHADRGALTFRYRWYYEEILEPADLVIPLVISEAGVDGIIGNRPGPSGYGWHDFSSYWVQQGWGESGVEAFINQLAWYDAGVRRDGYVIGFTVFTAGGFGHWKKYDINPILPQLTGYVVSQRSGR